MISIVAIICYVSANRSLSQWNFQLAPNTVISIFVTAAKTSMLLAVAQGLSQLKWIHYREKAHSLLELDHFEEASRGPWGAFMFLCTAKRSAVTAALGAFIVVVSLAMDPFAQQVISFETRYVPKPGMTALIPTSTTYDSGTTALGVETSPEDFINPEMQGFYYSGLFHSVPALPFDCATGNCTWPDFTTLGVCSRCRNITSTVNYTVGNAGARRNLTRTYHTPGGVAITTVVSPPDKLWKEQPLKTDGVVFSPFSWINGNGSENLYGSPPFMERAVFATIEFSQLMKYGRWERTMPDITECELSWCAKLFSNVSVTNATMSNYIVEDIALRPSTKEKPFCNMSETAPIAAYEPVPKLGETTTTTNATFGVNCFDMIATQKFVVGKSKFNISGWVYNEGFVAAGVAMLKRNDIAGTIRNISDAMTRCIQSGRNSEMLTGIALYPEVYVVVRWAWIVLPATLVLLGAIFLALTVMLNSATSGKSATPLWKSSLVPLLFHGLEGWTQEELRTEKAAEMLVASESMKARLQKNEDGDAKFLRA
ncbi:hypothetical protein IWZ01DRAFT_542657 [Phyllosticta capitalensis]